ncbi:MAG: FliM/FliN family flagellar motor switch protein [Pseudomonas sp.]|jgi:type III secretion protein Q
MTCRENEPELAWLEWHDPHSLALHNRLQRRRETSQLECAGHAFGVQWASAVQPLETGIEIALQVGENRLRLNLPVQVWQALSLPDCVMIDPQSLACSMLLEWALLPLIERVEQLAELPVSVIEPAGFITQPLTLNTTLAVQIGQAQPVGLSLHMSQASAELVADLLDRHATPASAEPPLLHLPLAVERGEAWLNISELRSLNPGDVVMLEQWPEGQLRLVLDAHLQARAELDGNTLKLLEQPIAMNSMKEHPMTATAKGQGLDSTLDELPLKLVCQVGSVEMSLAQLRELGAGSLVQLTPQLHDGVDLMVNGRRIGQGQLVKIGDGLGVRLLSFATV